MSLADEIRNGDYKKKKLEPLDLTSKSKANLEKIKASRPVQQSQEPTLWDRITSFVNFSKNNSQPVNNLGQMNTVKTNSQKNAIQGPQLPQNSLSNVKGRNVGQSDISTIQNNNLKLAQKDETKDSQEMTLLQQQARKKAEKKNENITRGGVDAFNEIADSLLNAVPSGVMSASAGLGNVATTAGATVTKTANKVIKSEKLDDVYDDIVNSGRYINEKGNFLNNVNSQVENGVVRDATNVIHTVSQMATNAGIGAVTGGSGSAVQGLSVGGSSAQEVLNEDKDKIYRAGITGATKGAVAYGIEKLSDFNILTKGTKTSSIQNLVNKKIAQKFSTDFGRKVASKITGITGENVEEFLEDNIDNVIDKLVNNKEMPGFKEWISNTTETLKATTLSTIIADLLGLGGGSYQDITNEVQKNTEAQKWINEAQKIIKNEKLSLDKVINSQPTAPINNQQNQTQTEPNLPTQQTIQEQNNVAQNGNMEQIKIDSENFSKQVDAIKNGTFPQKDMLTLGKTPQALKDIGLPDLPITMTQRHLDTIMNESGKYKNANYHGLGEEIVKQLPEAINNPLDIVKSNTKDDSVVLTTYLADKQDRPVIASIKIDGKGRVNDIMIDTNVMTSAYGRNNYDKFMQDNIKNGNLLYDIDRGVIKKVTGARLQLPRTSNFSTNDGSFVNNSVPQNTNNVNNTTINNYAQNVNNDTQNQPTASVNNNKDINPYRDTARANKLIKEKNELIRQVEANLKKASLPQAKDILNQRIQEIENDYNEKIQGLYDNVNRNQIQNEIEATEKNPTRHEIIQKNREVARENIKNISDWKDKKRGLSYQLETMERNMYDIIPDKVEAQKINETYFEPIHTQEAKKQRFINKYNDRIKQFNLNKYESEAVQLLGEQKYNPDFKTDEVKEVLDRVKKNIENGKVDRQKVNIAIEEFRTIYDELFEQENKALRDNGYKEKPYRKGYFPHFVDYVPETRTERVLNALGFKIDKRSLPTDIAGITEQFVPGKTWNKSALERKTNKTDYNALKGFDTYIAQASDNIFHTENIQRLRGLENEIRYQYSDKGIQERIDKILNDETLYAEEKQDLINNIFEQVDNPMPNLVTELRRYTNALANKKSEADRSIENMIGRNVYSTVNAIENRFGANAVGLNIGSAVTNFIPITQAWSQVSTKNMGRAVIDTIKSYINNDGFVDNSTFLTSRVNQSENLYKTNLQKISDKTGILFDAIDNVTSNIVVRGKYLENIGNGMTQIEAMKDADQFARNVIADRSKGALPTKFEEKNPVTKVFTQFQLEVNNQYRYMFKDLPRDLAEKGLGSIALAFFKMFIGAWLYNEASERITGRRPAFDPIELIKSTYKDFTADDKTTYDKLTGTLKNVAEELPFVGSLVGGGRIPLNGALPSVSNITKAGAGLITGEMDSKKAVNTIGKEFAKPTYYLLPPFGGAQLKKSVEGIKTVLNGGSYGVDKEGKGTLQFPVENPTAKDYVKAGVFGKYALPLAKIYTDSNYKSLNAKQTQAYKNSKIPYKEYLEYLNQDLNKTADKINYLNNQNWTDNQKWGIYTNEIFSNKERENGGSQLEDAKYAINKGTSKSEYIKLYNQAIEKNISMPTKDEMQKIEKQNLTLKNYMEYQIKLHDKTAEYKKTGKISKKGQLKDKDKVQILLDSKYTDNQKSAIYENYIKSKEKDDTISEYEIMKNAGMNINEWLKYSQQEFENDREDDGTLKGKSVKDTGKEKMMNYINNADISYEQRLLLLGIKYTLENTEKEKVINYINSLDIDYSTRLKILNKVKGITVYKNGTIKF